MKCKALSNRTYCITLASFIMALAISSVRHTSSVLIAPLAVKSKRRRSGATREPRWSASPSTDLKAKFRMWVEVWLLMMGLRRAWRSPRARKEDTFRIGFPGGREEEGGGGPSTNHWNFCHQKAETLVQLGGFWYPFNYHQELWNRASNTATDGLCALNPITPDNMHTINKAICFVAAIHAIKYVLHFSTG